MPHNHPIHDHPVTPGTSATSSTPSDCRCQEWADLLKTINHLQATNERAAIALCQATLNSGDPDLPPSLRVELNVILAGYIGEPWRQRLVDAEAAMVEWKTRLCVAGKHEGRQGYPTHVGCLRRGIDEARRLRERMETLMRPALASAAEEDLVGLSGYPNMRVRPRGQQGVFETEGLEELQGGVPRMQGRPQGRQSGVETGGGFAMFMGPEMDTVDGAGRITEITDEEEMRILNGGQPFGSRAQRRAAERADRKARKGRC